MIRNITKIAALLATVAGVAAASPSFAADTQDTSGVKVGVLECTAAGGWGLILGSSRAVDCTFQPTADRTERYTGTLNKIGMDIGYKGRGEMVWTVIAPTASMAPGALAGNYGGLTAGATAGVGVAAHAMTGGSDKHVALQPLSVEGNTGLNASAGIAGLNLTYVGS
jgi:hypothetical protein